jgi:Fibrinogen beta and gamma chains, C-terminal globular domain
MANKDGSLASAIYWSFSIDSESNKYKLAVSGYDGKTGGDALGGQLFADWVSNGQPFSTTDHDNDQWLQGNCAKDFGGGWWLTHCSVSFLNADTFGHWITLYTVHSSKMAVSRL